MNGDILENKEDIKEALCDSRIPHLMLMSKKLSKKLLDYGFSNSELIVDRNLICFYSLQDGTVENLILTEDKNRLALILELTDEMDEPSAIIKDFIGDSFEYDFRVLDTKATIEFDRESFDCCFSKFISEN